MYNDVALGRLWETHPIYLNLIDVDDIIDFIKTFQQQHMFPIFTKFGTDHLQTNPKKTYLMYF